MICRYSYFQQPCATKLLVLHSSPSLISRVSHQNQKRKCSFQGTGLFCLLVSSPYWYCWTNLFAQQYRTHLQMWGHIWTHRTFLLPILIHTFMLCSHPNRKMHQNKIIKTKILMSILCRFYFLYKLRLSLLRDVLPNDIIFFYIDKEINYKVLLFA